MSEADDILHVVREWIAKAENNLKNAIYTLGMGHDCPTDTVCFHAHQCVEKYLKAFLALKSIDFPRAHDIAELTALLPAHSRPRLSPEEQEELTEYATVTRYPGDYGPISLTETRWVVSIARRVRREVRKLLPQKVLRQRRP